MAEDISKEIRKAIESNEEQARRNIELAEEYRRREAATVLFHDNLSNPGVEIKELPDDFADEGARYLLAGYVSSLVNAGVFLNPPGNKSNSGRFFKRTKRNTSKGWGVALNTYTVITYGDDFTRQGNGIVTPEYVLISTNRDILSVSNVLLRSSVVNGLVLAGVDWSEPSPDKYQ